MGERDDMTEGDEEEIKKMLGGGEDIRDQPGKVGGLIQEQGDENSRPPTERKSIRHCCTSLPQCLLNESNVKIESHLTILIIAKATIEIGDTSICFDRITFWLCPSSFFVIVLTSTISQHQLRLCHLDPPQPRFTFCHVRTDSS